MTTIIFAYLGLHLGVALCLIKWCRVVSSGACRRGRFDEAWFALNKLLADGVELAKTKKEECELAVRAGRRGPRDQGSSQD